MTRFWRSKGRYFTNRFELSRMNRDIEQYQVTYGTSVEWYFYVPPGSYDRGNTTHIDPIYDEGYVTTGGKRYDGPRKMPVLSAFPIQGDETRNDTGFFTLDRITLRMSYDQARRAGLVPEVMVNHEQHLLDRFVYRGIVYDVMNIQVQGHFDQNSIDTVVAIDGTMLRPDELLDSPDFAAYSG